MAESFGSQVTTRALEIARENLSRSVMEGAGYAQIAADRLMVQMLEEPTVGPV